MQPIRKIPTYWLTRFLILRALGVIYTIAFLIAINQIIPLIGSDGLLPVNIYLERLTRAGAGFWQAPSIFWMADSDAMLLSVAWIGLILSIIMAIGFVNAPMLAVIWLLYMSIVHVGQDWYSFGWEILLGETAFLCIFLCPLVDPRPFPKRPPPIVMIWLLRWLTFRVMLGAGLIKIRGDEAWRNSTALFYHFETQPIPGPLSRWFHFLPPLAHKLGVWFNHLAELVAPWFVFWPRIARIISGIIIIAFQFNLFLSGNLSFLNWLTMIPALACFDDAFWAKLLPNVLVRKAVRAEENSEESRPMRVTSWVVAGLVVILSTMPVANMISPKQVMNTSFEPFDLVNTYGAFGTVGRERFNVVFEGTMDETPDDNATWRPYLYKGLPVTEGKPSPLIAPYHLRFDWQMWFAAMSEAEEYPWTFNLVSKLLRNDPETVGLFAVNPFSGNPPRYIRAVYYQYRFAKPGSGKIRDRERLGLWMQPMSANDPKLIDMLKRYGWMK